MPTVVHSQAPCPIVDLPSGQRVRFARHAAEVTSKVADELREHRDAPGIAELGITFEGEDLGEVVKLDRERIEAEQKLERELADARAEAEKAAQEAARERESRERLELDHQAAVQAEVERRVAEMRAVQATQQAALEPEQHAPANPLDAITAPADDATIDDILEYVGEDRERAAARLQIEQGREKPRPTLVEKLTDLAG